MRIKCLSLKYLNFRDAWLTALPRKRRERAPIRLFSSGSIRRESSAVLCQNPKGIGSCLPSLHYSRRLLLQLPRRKSELIGVFFLRARTIQRALDLASAVATHLTAGWLAARSVNILLGTGALLPGDCPHSEGGTGTAEDDGASPLASARPSRPPSHNHIKFDWRAPRHLVQCAAAGQNCQKARMAYSV